MPQEFVCIAMISPHFHSHHHDIKCTAKPQKLYPLKICMYTVLDFTNGTMVTHK